MVFCPWCKVLSWSLPLQNRWEGKSGFIWNFSGGIHWGGEKGIRCTSSFSGLKQKGCDHGVPIKSHKEWQSQARRNSHHFLNLWWHVPYFQGKQCLVGKGLFISGAASCNFTYLWKPQFLLIVQPPLGNAVTLSARLSDSHSSVSLMSLGKIWRFSCLHLGRGEAPTSGLCYHTYPCLWSYSWLKEHFQTHRGA